MLELDAESEAKKVFGGASFALGVAMRLAAERERERLFAVSAVALPEVLERAIDRFRFEGVVASVDAAAVWFVLVDALVLLAMTGTPDAAQVEDAGRRLRRGPQWAMTRWEHQCAAAVRDMDESRRAAWLSAFEAEPVLSVPPEGTDAAVTIIRSSLAWKLEDPFQLWDDDIAVPALDLLALGPNRVLLAYDPVRWFDAIDRWSDPRLVHAALFISGARESRETLLLFLRRAAPCFDTSGDPSGRAAAIVLCDFASRLAVDLVQRADGATKGDEQASAFIVSFAQRLLERVDGQRLAAALSAWIARDSLLLQGNAQGRRDVRLRLLEGLSSECVKAKLAVSDYMKFATERANRRVVGGRVRWDALPAFLAAMHGSDLSQECVRNSLGDWLCAVLSAPEEWMWPQPNMLVEELLALLREGPEATARCQRLCEELEGERRRAEFVGTGGKDYRTASLVLLAAMARLVSLGLAADDEAALTFVRDRALRVAFTEVSAVPGAVSALDVASLAVAIGVGRFGMADARAKRLAAPLTCQARALTPLLERLPDEPDQPVRRELLRAFGLDLDGVWRSAVQLSEATGRPLDVQVAERLERMMPGLQSP
jgi:hypothetical protein